MRVLIAACFLLLAHVAYAQDPNGECAVIVPQNPLSANGLATPYQLVATNAANGPCNQANNDQTAFVEAVIYDPVLNQLLAYHPLVIDRGAVPLANPVVPQFAIGSSVGIWFGFNGPTIILQDNAGSLAGGACVNGLIFNGVLSPFGQYAYCGATNFFATVKDIVRNGIIQAPPLGVAFDGTPCPTVRDYALVDMDPGDNVVTTYLVNVNNGRVAQNTTLNLQRFQLGVHEFRVNPSDNRLITSIDAAIECKPWQIRSLDDPENLAGIATLATNELHAMVHQKPPIALVPLNDPMAKLNNQPSKDKVNLYRAGLGQPIAATPKDADSVEFCKQFYAIHPGRLLKYMNRLLNIPSPTPDVADSLFTFLAQRFFFAFGPGNLNCVDILRVNNPVNLTIDGNGLVVGAIINLPVTPPPPVVVPPPQINVAAPLSMVAALFLIAAALLL